SIRATLFTEDRDGYSKSLVDSNEVKSTILNHEEFKSFASQSLVPFTGWSERAALQEITVGQSPKQLIHTISEDLLNSYAEMPLIDKYNVYQILMNYWSEIMQDDVYVLTQAGWETGNGLRDLTPKKGEKHKETP